MEIKMKFKNLKTVVQVWRHLFVCFKTKQSFRVETKLKMNFEKDSSKIPAISFHSPRFKLFKNLNWKKKISQIRPSQRQLDNFQIIALMSNFPMQNIFVR